MVALGIVGCIVLAVTAGDMRTEPQPARSAVAIGPGGAVATGSPYASRAAIEVLDTGGNAVDAAVAAAATLGVVEPFSAGIGGGGYLVYFEARTGTVHTLDGRSSAPAATSTDTLLDRTTRTPFSLVRAANSALSIGVPGTPATWDQALRSWGTIPLARALEPAIEVAENGFVINQQFRDEAATNERRFRTFDSTAALFLPHGQLPMVGSRLRNPDLAATYRHLARHGARAFYEGPLAEDIATAVQRPPRAEDADRRVQPGVMRSTDLAAYLAVAREPTRSRYRGLDVYGVGPSSSGGATVGETLNILDRHQLGAGDRAQALHHYLEASRLAFADRNRWVGDPDFAPVPTRGLLSDEFADYRARLIGQHSALSSPLVPGDPSRPSADPAEPRPGPQHADARDEGTSTTHLVTADRDGNVVAYTFTIEQVGGSAITVPGRGFILNNELIDFDFSPRTPGVPSPNLPGPGKRPRSSMSPTIVLRDGKPLLALGSPGGSKIITTVAQTLVNRLDLGMTLPDAVAAPRASQRDFEETDAESAFLRAPERPTLERLGHRFALTPSTVGRAPTMGSVSALEFLPGGLIQATAEPTRSGGGSAMVVAPPSP